MGIQIWEEEDDPVTQELAIDLNRAELNILLLTIQIEFSQKFIQYVFRVFFSVKKFSSSNKGTKSSSLSSIRINSKRFRLLSVIDHDPYYQLKRFSLIHFTDFFSSQPIMT